MDNVVDRMERLRQERHEAAQYRYSEIVLRHGDPQAGDAAELERLMAELNVDQRHLEADIRLVDQYRTYLRADKAGGAGSHGCRADADCIRRGHKTLFVALDRKRSAGSTPGEPPTTIGLTRAGEVPVESYGQATIHWLAGRATNGARELMVGLTTIAAGGASPLHRHPNCEEVLHLLRGEIDNVIDGHPTLRMRPGDTVTVPRDVRHRAINVGDGPAEMMVIFSSPQRETIVEDPQAAAAPP